MAGPVTGKFKADFESFYDAVEKAQVSLRSFEGDSVKVEKQINRVADSFSGRRIIQEAALVSEAIKEIGGVSKLSTDEAARGLRTLDQAMDKMLRTGEEIPTSMMKTAAELRRVGRASDDADAAVHRISSSYRQFDGILQSLGINIGPYVKGLEDITALVTKGIPGLGAFGIAAAAIGTAIAGWKLGEHAGEMYGWTEQVARGWAVLKGYGDVAEQTALAQADAIDLLGKAQDNWKRQAEATAEATRAAQEHTETMQREGMVTAGNAAHMMALANQLDAVKAKRKADAEAARLQAHEQFFFGEQTEKTTQAIVEQTVAIDRRAESIKQIMDVEAERRKQVDTFMNSPTLNDRAPEVWGAQVRNLTQTDLNRLRNKNPLLSGDANLRAELERLEAMEGNYAPKSGKQFAQMQADTYLLAQLRMYFEDQPRFYSGVENFEGGLAYVHKDEALVNMPKGTSVIPANRAGSGGIVFAPVINVNAGLGDRMTIGRAIKDVLVAEFKSFGYRGGVPFGG